MHERPDHNSSPMVAVFCKDRSRSIIKLSAILHLYRLRSRHETNEQANSCSIRPTPAETERATGKFIFDGRAGEGRPTRLRSGSVSAGGKGVCPISKFLTELSEKFKWTHGNRVPYRPNGESILAGRQGQYRPKSMHPNLAASCISSMTAMVETSDT
jgi:hypothetical protein